MSYRDLKSSVMLKIFVIAALVIILMVPTTLVQFLITDRENVQNDAINEVSTSWSMGQTIVGPYITIPYIDQTVVMSDSTRKVVTVNKTLFVLPNQLNINGDILPETRYRGIYEVVVYDSKLNLKGNFEEIDFEELGVKPEWLLLDQAKLNVGITDLKGIENQIELKWNDSLNNFNPSIVSKSENVNSGINSPIEISLTDSIGYNFEFNLNLKGSQHIFFTPVGKTTITNLKSSWDTPSFSGKFLPDTRNTNENGFTAAWKILHLNRNYPQMWLDDDYIMDNEIFGTNLMLPVDNYTKSDRVIKYAILFIVLTFLAFFFVEVMNKVYIHPIQYLLVGLSLVVFYVLLVSFSEHLLFNLAYWLATILTLVLISGYTWAITKSKAVGGVILGILSLLYMFIFTIIQLEDYSLLIGSIGMFVILAFVMFTSRKIDWYKVKLGDNSTKEKKGNYPPNDDYSA